MAAAVFRAASLALACAACTSVAVDDRTFEGTHWHVRAINGRATPANTSGYRVEFRNGGISDSLGCNMFGGRYSVERNTLSTPELNSTLMACTGPGMTFEREGLPVLTRPMRMTWESGRRLTVSNAAGSLELERIR